MNQWTILTLFLVSIVFVVLILSQSLLKRDADTLYWWEIRYESVDNSYFISRLYCVCCPDLVTITAQKRRRHPLMMRDKIWISGQFLLYFSSLLCLLSWSCHNHCSKGRHPLMRDYESVDNSYVSIVFVVLILSQSLLKRDADTL